MNAATAQQMASHRHFLGLAFLGSAVGLYLIAWGIFTAYMFIASLRVSVAVAVVFFLLATTFIVLGIGNAEADKGIEHAGGYIAAPTAP